MKFIITTSVLFSLTLFAQAQSASRLKAHVNLHKPHTHYSLKNASNEITFSLTALFILYKSVLSSQDGSSCTFTPSCSEYALQAINKKGLIVGSLMTFDRLTRCNGLNPDKYPYDYKRQLFIDPVE
jgi:putative membrane protein insertion efficiency factor